MVKGGLVQSAVRRFVATPLADWVLASTLLIATDLRVLLGANDLSWQPAVAALDGLSAVALGWRRRSPLLVMVVVCGFELAAVSLLQHGAWNDTGITLFVASYSVGANASRRQLLVALCLPLITTALATAAWPGPFTVAEAMPFVSLFLVGLPATAGWVIRDRCRLVGCLEKQTAELEAEREATLDVVRIQERIWVAAELEAVVSATTHRLLAQVALAEKDSNPAGLLAVVELENIARQGLTEMRRLLVTLAPRGAPATPESRGLRSAVLTAARSGAEIIGSRQPDTGDLEPAVELAASRIIELFVNGAPGALRIEIEHGSAGLHIRLEGRSRDEFSRDALLALSERATLLGGTVDFGPAGRNLRVWFPKRPQARPSDVQVSSLDVSAATASRPWLVTVPWPALLAVADCVLLQAEVQTSALLNGPRLLNALAVLAVTAPLAACRRRPLLGGAASLLAQLVMSVTLTPVGQMAGATVLWLVLPFCMAVFADRGRALLGLGTCGTVLLVSGWLALPGTEHVGGAAAVFCAFVVGAWFAGLVVRDRSRLVRELTEVNRRLIEERDAAARRVVLEERARVAHELHDVIGHSLTVIVLQAGAARRVWETDRATAHRHLASIARVASESLNELLRSLALLNVGYSIAGRGLDRFEDVLQMARLAGVRVELRVDGEAAQLSPSAELAAYRMVQEALTNAMKHAPGAPVQLCVRYCQQAVELEVRNALVAAPPNGPLTSSGGHGLIGLRQRILACGGALEWNCQESAFCVRARLPVLG